MYRPPGLPKWHHRLLLSLACFDGHPTADEIASSTGYRPATCQTYLSAMARSGLVSISRREDEDGFTEITYRLSDTGEKLFEEIVGADAALKRLARRRLARPY